MRLLAIETATPTHSVAVVEDERLLAELSYETQGHRGGMLLPTIDHTLKKAGMAARQLDAVAVSIGPGSFTGLRVGLATAQGLALGAGAKVVGVSTLEALAEGYAQAHMTTEGSVPTSVTVCALIDAYRSEVYMAVFRRTARALERVIPDAVLALDSVAAVLATLEGAVSRPIHLIGNGSARYRDELETTLGGRAYVSDEGLRAAPSAAWVARLGLRQLAGVNRSETEATQPDTAVEIMYLRRPEAEVKWEQGMLKSPFVRVM